MDTEDDLANGLLMLAGTIMEDVAPVAIVMTGDLGERMIAIRAAGQDIVTLANAAQVVHRQLNAGVLEGAAPGGNRNGRF